MSVKQTALLSVKNVKLEVMRRLMKEFEESLKMADVLETAAINAGATTNSSSVEDYIIELSKASGLVTQLSKEATYLAGDVNAVLKAVSVPTPVDFGAGSKDIKDILELFSPSPSVKPPAGGGNKN